MINNKEYRKSLIDKFLNAETCVKEEQMLADYYASNVSDDDEKEIAQLILLTQPRNVMISDEAVEEFDRIVAKTPRKRMNFWRWGISAISAAAVIALVLFLKPVEVEESSAPMLDIIYSMTNLKEFGHVKHVETEMIDEMLFFHLTLDDGQEVSYVMMKNDANGTLTYLPANISK